MTTSPQCGKRIHETAVIDPTAEIDPSASVGPYAVIGPDVKIGANTLIHNHVCVIGPTTIGRDNVIYPFAVLGAEPQDLKFHGEHTELIVGDRNHIREHVTIHRGTEVGGGKTVVGDDCLIMVSAHIAHDCIIENEVVIANSVMLGGHCQIEFSATIAGGAGLHHYTTVGPMAFVGGLARIAKDVPPFLVVEGSPAEPRKVNTVTLQRHAWPPEEIEALRTAFKQIYRGDDPMAVTVTRLREEPDVTNPVLRLCEFLDRMQTGVHGRHLEPSRQNGSMGR